MTRHLRTLERRIVAAENALLLLLVALMVGLSFLQVVLRGAFSAGLLWADTFLRHLVLWVCFLGAGVAAAHDKQFAMDALTRVFTGRVKEGVGLLCSAATLAVTALLTKASWTFFASEYASAGTLFMIGEVQVPTWIFEIILPAGFALLFVHYAIKAVIHAEALIRGLSKD